jgi:type II secretory pathway pseudopilin PulG
MTVAVALFAVVMVICVSTLLALINANKKAQALQSVMNNLNITLDGMARAIRQGHNYYCGTDLIAAASADLQTPYPGGDCSSGDNPEFAFEHYGGSSGFFGDQWVYKFDAVNNRILKSENGGTDFYAVTSPEVRIDSLKFYVTGSQEGDPTSPSPDTRQPQVIISIKGTAAPDNAKTQTTFHIQVAATQRLLDLY